MLTKRGPNLLRLESTPVVAYFLIVLAIALTAIGSYASYYGCRGYFRGYSPDWDAICSGVVMLSVALLLALTASWLRRNPSDCVLFDIAKKRATIIRSRKVEKEVAFAEFFPLKVNFIKSKRPQGIGHWELACSASKFEIYYTSSEEDAQGQKNELEELIACS
mgnify:CR=1 FL=1